MDELEAWIASRLLDLLIGVAFLIMGGAISRFFYIPQMRKMKEEISELKRAKDRPLIQQTFISGAPTDNQPTAYNPADGRMFFGTTYGDMAVRFHDAETIIDDINAWLLDNDLKGPVSPESVKAILRSRIRAQSDDS